MAGQKFAFTANRMNQVCLKTGSKKICRFAKKNE